jgi:hypothetical protein
LWTIIRSNKFFRKKELSNKNIIETEYGKRVRKSRRQNSFIKRILENSRYYSLKCKSRRSGSNKLVKDSML